MPTHAFLVLVLLAGFAADARAVTIEWSTVGNPGNVGEISGVGAPDGVGLGPPKIVGAVNYTYRIGTYDVTASQYVEFLNAKDSTGSNSLGLYTSTMSNASFGGIAFNPGNADGSKYSVISGRENHPANGATWFSAVRFANWMNNGQGNGDTESGSYTILGATPTPSNAASIARTAGATIFLASEDEWYKAAYYNPASNSYFTYPTSSNSTPIASGPTALPNHVNVPGPGVPLNLTDVGAYSGTMSPYGLFDAGGNVWQWNEALVGTAQNGTVAFRGVRGSSFLGDSSQLRASLRESALATTSSISVGFRLVNVPEPSSFVLAALGLIGLVLWRRRNR